MKRLFDDNDKYLPAAENIADNLRHHMAGLIEQGRAAGYSIRDIEYILTAAVTDLCLEAILLNDQKRGSNGS